VKLNSLVHLVPSLRKRGALPPIASSAVKLHVGFGGECSLDRPGRKWEMGMKIQEELKINQSLVLSVRISGLKPGVSVLLGVQEDILGGYA
jgi:hypothetical protein